MFDWAEYLDLADKLGHRASQACQRAALHCAYYAVYHLYSSYAAAYRAKNPSAPVPPKSRSDHWDLGNFLLAQGDPDVVDAGRILNEMRDARNRADYEASVWFGASAASRQVAKARYLVSCEAALRARL